MQNYSENIVQSKGNWRAITYDWNILDTYSKDNYCLYCLSDFQAAWLLSNVVYLSWITRQINYGGTTEELNGLAGELEYRLMNCLDLSTYQLQTLYENSQNQLLETYANDWDGSLPSSVNPDAPDDYFDGDASPAREDGLCTGLTLWAYSYAVEWMTKASTILGVTAFVSELVNFLIPAGGNIAAQVLSNLTAPLQSQLDAFQNQTALDTVICDWKNALQGVAITPPNWNNELAGLTYTAGTDEYIIQEVMVTDTSLLANFLSFVNALGNGYKLAQLGISICPCTPGTLIVVTFDGTGYPNWTILEGNLDIAFGNPMPSGKSAWNSGINTQRIKTRVDLGAEYTILGLNFDGWATNPSNTWTQLFQLRDASLALVDTQSWSHSLNETWINRSSTLGTVAGVRYIDFVVGKYQPTASPSYTLYMDNLAISYE
jgi:hypothetical protein